MSVCVCVRACDVCGCFWWLCFFKKGFCAAVLAGFRLSLPPQRQSRLARVRLLLRSPQRAAHIASHSMGRDESERATTTAAEALAVVLSLRRARPRANGARQRGSDAGDSSRHSRE